MKIPEIKFQETSTPLYIQLYHQIRELIINGEITEKLPPIRKMAETLQINSVTVINAYKKLEKEALIERKAGSGSYIKYKPSSFTTTRLDFTGFDSNIDSFPLKDIKDSISNVLENEGLNAFKYEESQGYPGLQKALVKYFAFYKISTNEDLIQIVSGGQQALDIISKSLLDFGDTVLTEAPTYKGALDSFKSRESRIISIDITEDGINLNQLESKLQSRRPVFIYIMPFNQKPTGINYSSENKLAILDLCKQYNCYIIEDDIGSEISLKSEEKQTLKSLDKNDIVIYIKSFTPLFMPGLRLGCIITPKTLLGKILTTKLSTDISTPGLLQRAFTHYLNNKNWTAYYSRVSINISKKIELTYSIIENNGLLNLTELGFKTKSPNFWFKLKKGNGVELNSICKNRGISIIPGESMGSEYRSFFRISLKSIPTENIERGLTILKESITELYSNRERNSVIL